MGKTDNNLIKKNLRPIKFFLSFRAILTIIFLCLLPILSENRELNEENKLLPPEFKETALKIKTLGLKEEKAYDFLKIITSVGGRLTGSPQADLAVERMFALMKELGFDEVKKEPVEVNRWIRGDQERGHIFSSKLGEKDLAITALGNSMATPPGGLKGQVIEVHSFEELESLKEKLKGKIVFYNVAMDRSIFDSFAAYGQAAQFRVRGASMAARYGAIASLCRSLTFRQDNYPRTGLMIYDEAFPKIPAAAVSPLDADLLSQWLKEDPNLILQLELACERQQPVVSANVMGEIRGTKNPKEIILLGAHLDSWDLGEGAHDDGAGCAVIIEALRLIKIVNFKPERTIRAVLFMDEEFGGSGGRAYASAAPRENEKHLVALEQDRGGFLPIGLAFGRQEKDLQILLPIQDILREMGIFWIRNGGGGADIAPLGEKGTILGSLIPDSHKYFDYHHSALDNIDAVHPRELELQAIILAILAAFLSICEL